MYGPIEPASPTTYFNSRVFSHTANFKNNDAFRLLSGRGLWYSSAEHLARNHPDRLLWRQRCAPRQREHRDAGKEQGHHDVSLTQSKSTHTNAFSSLRNIASLLTAAPPSLPPSQQREMGRPLLARLPCWRRWITGVRGVVRCGSTHHGHDLASESDQPRALRCALPQHAPRIPVLRVEREDENRKRADNRRKNEETNRHSQ